MKRYFHASPRRLRIGTVLSGQFARRLDDYRRPAVFMTNDSKIHYTVYELAMLGEGGVWHIYEVIPLGKIKFASEWYEFSAPQARVVKYIGTARGISKFREEDLAKLHEPNTSCPRRREVKVFFKSIGIDKDPELSASFQKFISVFKKAPEGRKNTTNRIVYVD